MRQWVPISKFATITAILDGSAKNLNSTVVANSPPSELTSLAVYVAPFLTCEHAQINTDLGRQILEALPRPSSWAWSSNRFPNVTNFRITLKSAIAASTGYDGLPYRAHDNRSEISLSLMHSQFLHMCEFNPDDPTPVNSTTSSSHPSPRNSHVNITMALLWQLMRPGLSAAKTRTTRLFANAWPSRSCLQLNEEPMHLRMAYCPAIFY